jgi:hypothetical protein
MGVLHQDQIQWEVGERVFLRSQHCPRNGKQYFSIHCESDTSLIIGADAPFIHDVAEGFIGGNLCSVIGFNLHLFPLSLPHPILD